MTQPRDNTGKEELVEEIAGLLTQWRRGGALEEDIETPIKVFEKDCPDIFMKTEKESAIALITLISQAIERGDIPLTKVPPLLPREVGRDTVWDIVNDPIKGKGIGTHGILVYDVKSEDTLIALSPAERKEGTEAEEMIAEYTEAAELNRALTEEHMEAFEEVVGKEEEK